MTTRAAARQLRAHNMREIVWRSIEAKRAAELKYDDSSAELQRDMKELADVMRELQLASRRKYWPRFLLEDLYRRQAGKCGCGCGEDLPALQDGGHHVDHHVIPWWAGKRNSFHDLRLLLAEHNIQKGAKCEIDDAIAGFRDQLLNLLPASVIATVKVNGL